jgi:hypothetical protein
LGTDIGEATVAFDRTDPADCPDIPPHPSPPDFPQPPDVPRPPDNPIRPPDPATREAFVHNYRDLVAQTDAAPLHRAQDTSQPAPETNTPPHEKVEDGTQDAPPDNADRTRWAEALPLLQAEWEEHKARYPDRERATPQTHPDGSWTSGETRQLSPDQNTEATKACVDIHDEGERVIFPAMQRVEAADPDRRLAGLEHMLKKADRLKEKVADVLLLESHLTPRQALDKVPDAVRYTFIYSPDRYADGVLADVERLKAEGFEEVKLKNLWTSSQYKGINSQWRRAETRLLFEVQFHTQESLEAKELTHEAYERLRRPETETTQAERDQLENYQRRANDLLDTPPGTGEIEDFAEKKR